MYFEVFLKIFISLFAVFGIYTLIELISEQIIDQNRVGVFIRLENFSDFEDVDMLISDAKSLCFFKNKRKAIFLVSENMYNKDAVCELLKSNNYEYIII